MKPKVSEDPIHKLSAKSVWFIAATAVAGSAVTIAAAFQWQGQHQPVLAVLAGFAAFLVRFDVQLFYSARVSVAVVPILVAGTVAGLPGIAVVVVAAELAAYIGQGRHWYRSVFNAGTLLVAGAAYVGVLHLPIGGDGTAWPDILYFAIVGTGLHFFVNSALVSVIIALTRGGAVPTVWKESFGSLLPHYALLGVFVAAVASVYEAAGTATAALALVPVILVRFVIQLQQAHKELQAAHEKILHMAYHDALTDLPNRQLFEERLAEAIERARESGRLVAVMFLDMDTFKEVNDCLGHAAGDELLRDIGIALKGFVRENDCASRISGDEFALMFPDLASGEQAVTIARRLVEVFRQPWPLEDRHIRSTASIGMAIFPEDGRDCRMLLRNADAAMYVVKQRGGDSYGRYAVAEEKIRDLHSIA